MDKRKPVGRTVAELEPLFAALPAARFCFDIGHARQVDPSMTEAALLLDAFGDRLAEVHMSEVNAASRHDPISLNAVAAFSRVAGAIREEVPIVRLRVRHGPGGGGRRGRGQLSGTTLAMRPMAASWGNGRNPFREFRG
ncbi:MAG: hypothetical protein IPM24_18675 [Bryobacterales bacterium]|nr:hypothetical protein [Bryobacterales bacterium]